MEYVPMAKAVYVRQQRRVFRDAVAAYQACGGGEGQKPERRSQASLMLAAMKASDNIALVSGVDVLGKNMEVNTGFDLATEAALAMIEHVKERKEAERLSPPEEIRVDEKEEEAWTDEQER
jgi:hypothetical protein